MKYYFLFILMLCSTISFGQLTVGVTQYDTALTQPGYNLFYPLLQNKVYLIDNCGRIVNEWSDPGFVPGSSVELLENGHLLKTSSLLLSSPSSINIIAGAGDKVHLKNWDNTILWEYTISNDKERMHHDIKSMPNGNVLILAWEKKTDEEAFNAGRDTTVMNEDRVLYPDFIVEVKPIGVDSGEVVWRWNAWDHMIQNFDSTKANYGVVEDHPELININYPPEDDSRDWLHINAIDYNVDLDQIIISAPGFNEVWIIDHSTTTEEASGHSGGNSGKGGDLIYRWGNPAAYNEGSDADQQLFFQHDAHWIDQGLDSTDADYGKILVFNNQAGENYSTVNMFAPLWNSENQQYELNEDGTFAPSSFNYTYQADNPADFYSLNISGAQKLPNGNLLICSGVQRTVFEITPQKEIVWQYVNPVRSTGGFDEQGTSNPRGSILFRYNRYAPDFLGFQDKDLSPGKFIELNPDGSLCPDIVDVHHYQLSNIEIYPNPTQHYFIIDNTNLYEAFVLYDFEGKKLMQQELKQHLNQISIEHVKPGCYLIIIDDKYFEKVIIH